MFSDSSDTSPEDLFSNKSQSDTRQNLEKKPVKTNTKSLFDSTDSATDDQHNNTCKSNELFIKMTNAGHF